MDDKRVACITAGARRIGGEIAECFVAEGVTIRIFDIDRAALDARLTVNAGLFGTCCDMSDPEDVKRLFVEFAAHGHRLQNWLSGVAS